MFWLRIMRLNAGCKGRAGFASSVPVTIVMGTFLGGERVVMRFWLSTSCGGPSSSLSVISMFMFDFVRGIETTGSTFSGCDQNCPQSPSPMWGPPKLGILGMAWSGHGAEPSPAYEDTDDLDEIAHIEDIDELSSLSDVPTLSRVNSRSDGAYDAQLSADIAGTTPTQTDFFTNRFTKTNMTATAPSPRRTGVSPSSSPRLPSPPPFTEVQIGPKSPTIGDGPENQLGEAAKQDDGSTRRIRPGTKAADMASGPPLIPLAEVCMFILPSELLLTCSSSSNRLSSSKNTSKLSITPTLAARKIP